MSYSPDTVRNFVEHSVCCCNCISGGDYCAEDAARSARWRPFISLRQSMAQLRFFSAEEDGQVEHSEQQYAGIRGGTICRAGRANAPPDFDARGENGSLPSHFSMASLPVVRLKFGEN